MEAAKPPVDPKRDLSLLQRWLAAPGRYEFESDENRLTGPMALRKLRWQRFKLTDGLHAIRGNLALVA
jgi:hypothetical protein